MQEYENEEREVAFGSCRGCGEMTLPLPGGDGIPLPLCDNCFDASGGDAGMSVAAGHFYKVCFVCPYCSSHNTYDVAALKPAESDTCPECDREYAIPFMVSTGRFKGITDAEVS